MFRVGLTGGIASGKTTVANLFAELGVGLVDTDILAREVVAPGEPGLDAIRTEFGADVLLESGELDRQALRQRVFRDPEQRGRLEAILHPLIRARAVELLEQLETPYAMLVVPLLLETGFGALADRVLAVDCSRSQQLARLIARDGISAADAEAMLSAQVDRETRLAGADDVIDNSGSLQSTHAQVRALHARYCESAHGAAS